MLLRAAQGACYQAAGLCEGKEVPCGMQIRNEEHHLASPHCRTVALAYIPYDRRGSHGRFVGIGALWGHSGCHSAKNVSCSMLYVLCRRLHTACFLRPLFGDDCLCWDRENTSMLQALSRTSICYEIQACIWDQHPFLHPNGRQFRP